MIISMDSRESMAKNRHEQENRRHQLYHILTEKYPHICQNSRCKKKVMFGWLYPRAKKQGISHEEFIRMWTHPSHERNENIQYLCYPCYTKKERKERIGKDIRYKRLYIQSSIEILFHKLIEYKHRTIFLRNDDNIKGRIWYENLIIYTFLKIYKIRQKITHSEFLRNINFTIKWGIRDFTKVDFIDMRITTLYFKMKWSIWKIKRYYKKSYRKLSDDRKKRSPKPTLKRIRKEIKKDKRFEKKLNENDKHFIKDKEYYNKQWYERELNNRNSDLKHFIFYLSMGFFLIFNGIFVSNKFDDDYWFCFLFFFIILPFIPFFFGLNSLSNAFKRHERCKEILKKGNIEKNKEV